MEARNTFTGGMNSDTSKRNRKNNDYTFASNFRLNTDSGESNGSLETIKGNMKLIEIPSIDFTVPIYNETATNAYADIQTSDYDDFDIIGYCEVRDDLVLFTTSTTTDNDGQLWYVTFDRSLKPGDIGYYDIKLIYSAELNFSVDTLIGNESIPSIEGQKTTIHWTDNENLLRSFNIKQNDALSVPVKSIDIISNIILGSVISYSGINGYYNSGIVQHGYKLYNSLTGKESNISQLSIPISLIKDNETDQNAEGGLIDVATGKKATVVMSNIDNVNFDKIKIYSFFRNTIGQNPIVKLVKDTTIPTSGSLSISDVNEANNESISFIDIMTNTLLFKAKTIEEKDNRLAAANITEEFFDTSSIDCRAYRFKNSTSPYETYVKEDGSASYITCSTGVSQIDLNDDLLNVISNNNAINPSNSTSILRQNTLYKYKPVFTAGIVSGIEAGGYGPIVEYTFNMNNVAGHAPWDGVSLGSDYSEDTSLKYKSYKRDEVYRFGIVFYNKKGQKSFVNWVGDIRMPDGDILGTDFSFIATDSKLNYETFKRLGLDFKIKWDNVPVDLKNNISGFKIVRVKRESQDKSIKSQGIIGATFDKYNTRDSSDIDYVKFSLMPITTPVIGAKYVDDGTGLTVEGEINLNVSNINYKYETSPSVFSVKYPNFLRTTEISGYVADPADEIHSLLTAATTYEFGRTYRDLLEYMSSDLDFNNEKDLISNDIIEIVGLVGVDNSKLAASTSTNYSIASDNTSTPTSWSDMKNASISVVTAFTADKYINYHNVYRYGINSVFDIELDEASANIDYIDVDISGPHTYDSKYLSSSAGTNDGGVFSTTTPFLANGTTSIKNSTLLKMNDEIDDASITDADNDISNIIKTNFTGDIVLDGEDILTLYFLVNIRPAALSPYNGNTHTDRTSNIYISASDYKIADCTTVSDSISVYNGDTFVGYYDYFRSEINNGRGAGSLKHGVINRFPCETSINLALRSDRLDPYYMEISKTGTYPSQPHLNVQGIRDVNHKDYNTVYSNDNDLESFISKPSNFNFIETKDTKIIISNKKINGELIDKWSKFDVNTEIETDTKYGPINDLINDNNKIVYFQDKAVGVVSVNERAIISTQDGTQTSLGSGGLLSRFDYITKLYGMKSKFGNTVGIKGVYFIDDINKKFISLQGGNISDIKGINKYLTGIDYTYEYVLEFNKHMNEVLISFKKPLSSKPYNYNDTISFNELFGVFNGFQSFMPDFYIKSNMELFSIPSRALYSKNGLVYLHDNGIRTEFYEDNYNNDIEYITIPETKSTAIFNNMEYMLEATDEFGNDDYEKNFNTSEFNTSYQSEIVTDNSLNSKRRMRVWRMQLPRHDRARFRDFYLKTKLTNTDNGYRLILNDVITKYNPNSY